MVSNKRYAQKNNEHRVQQFIHNITKRSDNNGIKIETSKRRRRGEHHNIYPTKHINNSISNSIQLRRRHALPYSNDMQEKLVFTRDGLDSSFVYTSCISLSHYNIVSLICEAVQTAKAEAASVATAHDKIGGKGNATRD